MSSSEKNEKAGKSALDSTTVPLAIIGIGCLFPKAENLGRYWANIKGRVDAIEDIPASHWSPQDYHDADPKKPDFTYAKKGGFIPPVDFDPGEFGISPNSVEATDPAQLLGLVAAQRALSDAGYGTEKEFDRSRVSVILGVTGTLELVIPLGARLGHPIWRKALAEAGVAPEVSEDVVRRIADSYVPWQEASFPGLLGNVVAGRIANRFNLGGTNCVVDAACASSLGSAHLASLELAARRSSMVVMGGVDTFNDIFMYMCFSKTPALSPSGQSRPFDKSADGTALGEGIGMIVLKRLDDAEADGDRIYAVLKGVGSSSDGRGKAIYAPSAEGQSQALREAYRVAGVTPDTIELVEAHGTGTTVGDITEVTSLKEVYNEGRAAADAKRCALGSVKSQIGHTKAAAGSAGMIKVAMALYHKVLPPTIKVTEPLAAAQAEDCPFYINTEKRPWVKASHPRRAAASALGFGGSNFHAVFEEHRPEKSVVDWDGDVQIAAFSGDSVDALQAGLKGWEGAVEWDAVRLRAAESREAFRCEAPLRLVLVIEKGKTDLKKLFASAAARLAQGTHEKSWTLPEGVYFAGGRPGKLAVLFPGQGSQYVGMGRDIFCQFPEAFNTLATGDESFEGAGRLSDHIYPQPVFSNDEKNRLESELRDTRVAQPALGVVALGSFKILESFGLNPDAVAGHSYGELPALTASGRIDEGALFALSALRGKLMAQGDGGRGGMLAVQAPLEDVEKFLKEEKLCLVLANKNSPTQGVLSGTKEEVAKAAAVLTEKGIRNVTLPVSAAFHSPLVEAAEKPFRKSLGKTVFGRGVIPVFANKTAGEYPQDSDKAKDILASQLASPVEFVSMIESMHKAGVTTFVEAAPGARLTSLVTAILGDKAQALAMDASGGRRCGTLDLAKTLAHAAALGHPMRLGLWEGGLEAVGDLQDKKKPKFSVKLTGATHRGKGSGSRPAVKPQFSALSARLPALPAAPAGDALRATQEGLIALQRLQEQTALIHAKFLEGQETAQRALQAVIDQQQRIFDPNAAFPVPAIPPPAYAPVAAAPVVPAAAPTPAPPVPPAAAGPDVEKTLIAVVSEKTGYPPEMLSRDMDLESDLGIDSIKRVEILSAVSEKLPGAPVVKPEHLGTLRTLARIVEFLSVPGAAHHDPNALPERTGHGGAQPAGPDVEKTLIAVVSEKTGYPPEMLSRDMDLESDLGIDSIKRVEILSAVSEKLPGAPAVKPEHLGTLRTLAQIVEFLSAGFKAAPAPVPCAAPVPAMNPAPAARLSRRVLRTVSFENQARARVGLDPKRPILVIDDGSGLSTAVVSRLKKHGFDARLVAWAEAHVEGMGGLVIIAPPSKCKGIWGDDSEVWLKESFAAAKAAGAALRKAGSAGGAVFATVSRLDGAFGLALKDQDPVFGGLAGLSKTASHEWTEVSCKALDVAQGMSPGKAAEAVVDEIITQGPLEVGVAPGKLVTLALEESLVPASKGIALKKGDVVIVTGGARGVTAETAMALAPAAPVLVLLGRTPVETEPHWLGGCSTQAEIQKAILANSEETLTPKDLRRRCAGVLSNREVARNIGRLESAGAKVVYRSIDIRDAARVKSLIREIVKEYGLVRGLIHGAGVLADKRIEEKTSEQFERVFDTKVRGLRNLLGSFNGSDPFVVLFSSTTARFGRVGQADYAMANEVLNKVARSLAARGSRAVALGWGPWDGGMVTPALKEIFAKEGVGVIGLEQGARHLFDELSSASVEAEVIVMAEIGSGTPAAQASAPGKGAELFVVYERELTLEEYPFLRSHVMGGAPVLPAAVIVEWLAAAALHGNPGLRFQGFDDLRIFKGVRLNGPCRIRVCAAKAARRDGSYVVSCEIRGAGDLRHAAARIVLADKTAPAPALLPEPSLKKYPHSVRKAYQDFLFHGEDLQGILSVEGVSEHGIAAESKTSLPPASWIRKPLRDRWLADPMALDAAFQAMILWSFENNGSGSLPSFLARYRQFGPFPEDGVRVVARLIRSTANLAVADIDFVARCGVIARIEGYECTIDASLNEAFKQRSVEAAF